MKTKILTLLLAFSLSGYSQIEKNTLMVGGHASLTIDTKSDYLSYGLSPNLGWFIAKNTVIGIAPSIGHRLNFNNSTFLNKNYYQHDLSVWSRYYINPNNRISFFPEVSAGIFTGTHPSGYSWELASPIRIGAAIWLTDNISIEPTIRIANFIRNSKRPIRGYFILKDDAPSLRVSLQIYLNREDN